LRPAYNKNLKMLSLSQFSTDTIIKLLQKTTSHYTAPAYFLILITQTRHKACNKRQYTCEILIFCHFWCVI